MGSDSGRTMRGFLIPDTRLTFAASEAAPSESTPRPGSAVAGDDASALEPVVSHAQGVSIDTYAAGAGSPNRDPSRTTGLALIWKLDSGSTWMGWDPPATVQRIDQVYHNWTSSGDEKFVQLVTIPSSQKVVMVYSNPGGTPSTGVADVRVLDPATWSWGSKVDVDTLSSYNAGHDTCIFILPNERLVVMQLLEPSTSVFEWRSWYSDDAGATWADYSLRPFAAISSNLEDRAASPEDRSRAVSSITGDEVLFVRSGSVATAYTIQYASTDFGTTFQQVGSDWTTSPIVTHSILALKSGGFGLIGTDTSGNRVVWARIGSAFDSLEDADKTEIYSLLPDTVTAWVDDDGTVWAAIERNGIVVLYYSTDEGSSWKQASANGIGIPFSSGDTSTAWTMNAAATSCGRAIVVGNSIDGGGGTTYDGMLWAVQLGGWTNVERDSESRANEQDWMPIELPDTISGWTVTGSGTATLESPGLMTISTTSIQTKAFAGHVGTTTERDNEVMIDLEVQSGGSTAAMDIGCQVRAGNGTDGVQAQVSVTATQYELFDGTTAVGNVITHGGGRVQIRVHVDPDAETATTWYRSPEDDTWTLGHDAESLTRSGSYANGQRVFGHVGLGEQESDWYYFGYERSTKGKAAPRNAQTTLKGKPLNIHPYPLVPAAFDSSTAAFLSVTGSARRGETHDIDVEHDYPAERVFVEHSPGTIERWRSTADSTEVILAQWDLEYASSLGNGSIGLLLEGINFRQATLQYSSNGSSWSTAGTLDAAQGTTTMAYALKGGDAIHANSASSSGAQGRYFWNAESVGGTLSLNSGTDLRRIRRQTEGAWHTNNTTRQAVFWFNGADGSEASTGTVDIWMPRALLVVHNVGEYRYWRVRIPSQATADGYYEVGRMVVGSIHPAGKQWDRGWSIEREPNTRRDSRPNGVERVEKLGPPRKRLTVSWQAGMQWGALRDRDPDYVVAGAGDPLAAADDVAMWLFGMLDDIDSGAQPVVPILKIPPSTTTITDWSQFLCGHVTSSPAFNHVDGLEDDNEFVRGESITIREIP